MKDATRLYVAKQGKEKHRIPLKEDVKKINKRKVFFSRKKR
jgi:hypothetical protein